MQQHDLVREGNDENLFKGKSCAGEVAADLIQHFSLFLLFSLLLFFFSCKRSWFRQKKRWFFYTLLRGTRAWSLFGHLYNCSLHCLICHLRTHTHTEQLWKKHWKIFICHIIRERSTSDPHATLLRPRLANTNNAPDHGSTRRLPLLKIIRYLIFKAFFLLRKTAESFRS